MRKNLTLKIFALLSFTIVAFAQDSSWGEKGFQYLMKGKYLPALVVTERAFKNANTQDERSQISQSLSEARSMVGDIRGAQSAFDTGFGYHAPVEELPPDLQAKDAITAIVKASEGRRVVILNEAHSMPQNRAFAAQLALELRKAGFTYLACETFGSTVNISNYPNAQTGYYTNEPVFADFVRQALKVGYQLVPYEQETFDQLGDFVDQINRRETIQAQNLLDRVLLKDPKSRVFVYVGWSHATETWEKAEDGKRDLAWMAARLARASGLDPLTIDQTELTEHSKPQAEHSMYQAALDQFKPDQPVVLENADGQPQVFGQYKGKVDMQVLHPRTVFENERPNWLRFNGLRTPVQIPTELLKFSERVLVQAFRTDEGEDAIPFDQVLVVSKRSVPKLLLEPGTYRLRVQDQAGKTRAMMYLVLERQP
jgi:tetratricopeptide (TPR) repeat protein